MTRSEGMYELCGQCVRHSLTSNVALSVQPFHMWGSFNGRLINLQRMLSVVGGYPHVGTPCGSTLCSEKQNVHVIAIVRSCGGRLLTEHWLGAQAKGVADAGSAAFRVSGLELGGLFGSLLAGRISDTLIARDPKGGNCGKRVQVRLPPPCIFPMIIPCSSC